MWQATGMADIKLTRAVTDHGAMPITVEEFATIVGTTPAVLRGRRDRDADFPDPITADASPLTYLMRDLVAWWTAPTRGEIVELDRIALARWRFTAGFEVCSAAHGPEATRRLVAGAALLLCQGRRVDWRAPVDETLPALRAHIDAVEPRTPNVLVRTSDFAPDPEPASDRSLLDSLLSWSGRATGGSAPSDPDSPLIPDHSPTAGRLLSDLRSLHRESRRPLLTTRHLANRKRNRLFIEIIEPVIRGMARDTSTRPSTSDLGLTRLMVAIADPRPGEVVVDLACGQGSTFIEAIRAVQPNDRTTQVIGCVGREQDELVWTIAKVRLGLRDIAHDLGQPEDGLTCAFEARPNHRFITDPGMRIPRLRRWTRRHLDLLDEDGVAVVAVPAAAVFRSNPGRWWTDIQSQIDSVVFTPTDHAVILLRRQASAWKSLVQIHRMTAAMAERRYLEHIESTGGVAPEMVPLDVIDPAIEPFMPAQLLRVVEQIGRDAPTRSSDRRPAEGEDDFVQWRPIRAFTLEALGEPRFGDCTAIRDAVPPPELPDGRIDLGIVRAMPEPEHAGHAGGRPSIVGRRLRERTDSQGRPIPSRASFAALREAQRGEDSDLRDIPRHIEELTGEAVEAVGFLRWLLDPSTLTEKPSFGAKGSHAKRSPKTNGALEEFGTEEMRRALRRLEQRLLGEETRGRRPQTGPDSSQ